ncbi:fimbrial protein [Salmonella enterica subsp. enterica serovar Kinondoni]|nr:fimbrial protein [Salmonella enterica subsp. enterica serovar Kinondoni]MKU04715.1 hypothetical protein [Salmonella enterica subsp. enterica serovar Kinondoni]
MNKVMNEENRRRGGRNTLCRLFRSGRWFLCLALLCSVMLPGFADAASAGDDGCAIQGGGHNITLKLPPSVSFEPGVAFPSYESPKTTVTYTCNLSSRKGKVAIVKLSDFGALNTALRNAGLKLDIIFSDSSDSSDSSDNNNLNTWTFPDDIPGAVKIDHLDIGNSYSGNTDKRTLTIWTKLSRYTSVPHASPGFYAVPPLTAFKLKPVYNTGSGPFVNTPPIRLQYVPKCFVKTSLNTNKINFGPVMTTDVDSSFSRKLPFTVTAGVNTFCNGGNLGNLQTGYKPDLTGAQTYYLNLPLKVSFILNNGGAISADNKSIILHKKGTETENGLQLQITGDRGPVTFGEISATGDTTLPPGNQFGNFQGSDSGGTWNISNTYHAVLSATGKSVITGSYSAQVTVKVEYY